MMIELHLEIMQRNVVECNEAWWSNPIVLSLLCPYDDQPMIDKYWLDDEVDWVDGASTCEIC